MTHKQNNYNGIIFMLAGMFLLVIMDALAKLIMSQGVSPVQILAIRSWVIVFLFLGYFKSKNDLNSLRTAHYRHHFVRGCFGLFAPLWFFTSLKYLPLADATVVFFSSTFIIAILSATFLKEPVGRYQLFAILIGFIGVYIAASPSGQGDMKGYFYCLLSSVMYSLLFISGRWMSRTESVAALVFYFNLSIAVFLLIALPFIWQPISTTSLYLILILSLFALFGHICITNAFTKAPAGVVSPFEYTSLIWAIVIGYLIWNEIPSVNVLIGAFIIISCAIVLIVYEKGQLKNK